MYTPLPYPLLATPGKVPFIGFIGHTSDQDVRDVDDNPAVEINLGVRSREGKNGSTIVLVWLFLSIQGSSGTSHLNEMGFNIGDPEMRDHLRILATQPFYDIVTCGEAVFTATRVTLPTLGPDILRVLSLAQRHLDIGWSQEEYLEALQAEWALHSDTESLFKAFVQSSNKRFEEIL